MPTWRPSSHVTKASLHYHFPGKAELGRALIARYATRFMRRSPRSTPSGADAPAMLGAYARLYADVLRGQRMCLCGMLAAEYQTLPEPMREAVLGFFDENESWVERVLDPGPRRGNAGVRRRRRARRRG